MTFINCLGGSSGAGRTFFGKVLIEFLWSVEEEVNIVDCDADKADLSRSYLPQLQPNIYNFGPKNSDDFYRLDDLLLVENKWSIVVDLPNGQIKNICDWLEYSFQAVDELTIYFWYLTRPNYKSLAELESLIKLMHTKGYLEIIYVRNMVEPGWQLVENDRWFRYLAAQKVMSIDFPLLLESDAGVIAQMNAPISSLLDGSASMQATSRSRIKRFLDESFQQIRSIYPIAPY
jgi:hypothetical protein